LPSFGRICKSFTISWTGRVETTFLVQLLTPLGLDTGFNLETMEVLPAAQIAQMGMGYFPIARAGMELIFTRPARPTSSRRLFYVIGPNKPAHRQYV
jgi:hypothetical protein